MHNEQDLEELERLTARVESLSREFAEVCKMVTEMIQAKFVGAPGNESPPHDTNEPASHYARVAKYLLSHGNQPRSAKAIARESGISRSSLSQILYRSHKDKFASTVIPGFARKKLWALTKEAVVEESRKLQVDLFGEVMEDFSQLSGEACCAKILRGHNNEPMNVLTMAREAIRRGYRGMAKGSDDDILMTTAKSFWAVLGRKKDRFVEVKPQVFRLKDAVEQPPQAPNREHGV
jgi:hypothetical protein